jgi:hypothetical protein
MKILILVDFDRTLFNTERMKRDKGLKYENEGIDPRKYEEIYGQVKQEYGFVNMEEVYRRLNKIIEGWGVIAKDVDASFPYKNYLFPEATEALSMLSEIGGVVIFTEGDLDGDETSDCYQAHKIKSCGLIYPARIFRRKVNALPCLIQGYDQVILIDDSDDVLNAAKNYPKIRCVKIGESSMYESYPDIYQAARAIREFISSQPIN